ncbi:MAG: sensor histidine kinase [Firmicutes bacterium]|jgi:signal transduction histidine kinase|nr:sensor histidine kinase [Bacillota bacterium]MDD4336763.1 sensor histidine kinase [Bacillota bacterium]MDD4793052.1 sensor histidine kinase [Bacillota bacterium]
MKIREYLAARLGFVVAHLLAGALCIAVIQLDLLSTGGLGLTRGSSTYIALLHLAMLVPALAADYSKQNRFYTRMREIAQAPDPLDHVPLLPGAKTAEQRIAGEFAHSAYSHYTSEMLTRDERSQFHIDFTNRWAHAMKTPVSVIDLLVQQSRETESQEMCALFESIQEENERIAHGLDMMLGMARQERFSVDLFPERVDLAELAREVINKHKKEFIRYSIYPRIEVTAGNACVETDRKWIAFVIDQLLSNAIKYTRVAPSDDNKRLLIRIEDKIKAEADAGTSASVDAVMLTVEDWGVGIPEHDLPRIFDPFFTGENGRLAPESTGMGLFLANRISRELGHSLTVRSERGRGTAMTITFASRVITSGIAVK